MCIRWPALRQFGPRMALELSAFRLYRARMPWQIAPVLGVPNVRRAAEHYRDALGFNLDPVNGVFAPSPNEPGGVYAIVMRESAIIHLQIRRGGLAGPKGEGVSTAAPRAEFERDVYVRMRIGALNALHQELVQRGATILQAPMLAPHGIREMVVSDLDGYRIAFGELEVI